MDGTWITIAGIIIVVLIGFLAFNPWGTKLVRDVTGKCYSPQCSGNRRSAKMLVHNNGIVRFTCVVCGTKSEVGSGVEITRENSLFVPDPDELHLARRTELKPGMHNYDTHHDSISQPDVYGGIPQAERRVDRELRGFRYRDSYWNRADMGYEEVQDIDSRYHKVTYYYSRELNQYRCMIDGKDKWRVRGHILDLGHPDNYRTGYEQLRQYVRDILNGEV